MRWLKIGRRDFFVSNPVFDLKNWSGILFSSFWCKLDLSRPKIGRATVLFPNWPVAWSLKWDGDFFAWKPDFDLKNTLLFLFSSFWSKSEVSRTKIERSRAVFSFGQTIVKNRQKWAKKGETETEMLVLNENSLQKFFREFREKRIFAIRPFFGISWNFDYVPGDSA